MWKRGIWSDDLLCRIQKDYPLPEGIELNPDCLIRLLKILEKVAPEQQFVKTVKLITRVFEKKTDECLKNGYAYAVACGDYVSAQRCLNILRNKDDLSPLFNTRTEDSTCLDNNGNKVDASSSIFPQNSVAINQVSVVDEKERSARNRLHTNGSAEPLKHNSSRRPSIEPLEHNSTRRPLDVIDRTEKQVRGRKHRFSEPKVQARQNVNNSGGSESDVSPKRLIDIAKQTLATRERDRGIKNISRESYLDDKSHWNRRRSKTKAEDRSSEDDTARSGSTRKQKKAPQRRSQSTHDLSVSPAKRRVGKTQLKNNSKRVAHSDSDVVLDNSSMRKPVLKNKKVVDVGKSTQPKVKPRHQINSSESESDLSDIREDSHKRTSLSRRKISNDLHRRNKVRPETSEHSESDESEGLFRPSSRNRSLSLDRGKLQTAKHKVKYNQTGSDSDDDSSPQRIPRKKRRPNRLKSISDSDSDNDQKSKSVNNKKTKYIGERNRRRTSREISSESDSESDDSRPTKKHFKAKIKKIAETDSEVDTVRSRPIKRKQTLKCSDSKELSNKPSKSKRSKSTHDLSTSTTKSKSKETIKNKTKRVVHSDTDVTLDNSSRKKTTKKSTKKLPITQEKAPNKNIKKQAPKQDSKPKKNACKSGKETTVKKNAGKKKPVNVDEELSDSKENVNKTGSSKLNCSQFMSRLKELESSILNNTPDPLPQKKGKNLNKSPVAPKTTDSSANGKKPPSANRKKTPIKAANKNNSKSTGASKTKISDKTVKPGAVKNQRKKAESKKGVSEKSPAKKNEDNVKTKPKSKRTVKKKTDESKPVKKGKGKVVKEPDNKTDEADKEDKSGLSLLASDHSFMSDSELDVPMGSLSTCLNSIKRQMPRPLGSATPPLSIFLRTNSVIMSDAASDISSLDRVSLKLDDKNVVTRMAKANRPDNVEVVHSSKSKLNPKINNTPEALRKIVNIKKKLEEKQTSDFECSSFSDS